MREFGIFGSNIGKILFIWGMADFVILFLLGVTEGNYGLSFYVVVIPIIYVYLYLLEPRPYLPTILFLVIIEETIVYYIGGGLHGEATSLVEDYVRAIPIFITMAYLWLKYMRKYNYRDYEILVMAGLHGFFFEIILSGIILSPLLLMIFGGTPFVLYGLLVLIPKRPRGDKDIGAVKKMVFWLMFLFVEILVGIATYIVYPG